MHSPDLIIQQYFLYARTPGLTEFMYLLTTLFDLSFLTFIATVCIGVLIAKVRGNFYGYFFVGIIYFGAALSYILKLIFNVARPVGGVMQVFGPSFPSYHATISTIFFLMLIYIFDDLLKPFWRIIFNTICIIGIILVSFSRIYLGVHWFSDVVFGIILGILVFYAGIRIINLPTNPLMTQIYE